MGQAKADPTLKNRSNRLQLPAGVRHQTSLARAFWLAYRRPKNGQAGTWLVRWQDKSLGCDKQCRIGDADDYTDADGISILTYRQAQEKAEDWFKEQIRLHTLARLGAEVHQGPYTVADAWADYIQEAERRGVKGTKIMGQVAKAQILPVLGSLQVAHLTTAKLKIWHADLANAPRRTGRKTPEDEPKPLTEDQVRARKDTANRVLTNLKAALNHALRAGMVQEPAPWRLVAPFQKTTSRRVRYLTLEEQRKLVAACAEDFRPLVMAALYTGARYGELTKVRAKDFDPRGQTLFIQFGKSKGEADSRHVFLLPEAVAWFKERVKGKPQEDLMFKRDSPERTKREDLLGFEGWASYDQVHAMEKAVKQAGIAPVTFHELRHTYATGLLNRGVPVSYVAEQLGHKGTRMCERHYGHLIKKDLQQSIMKNAPKLGLTCLVKKV